MLTCTLGEFLLSGRPDFTTCSDLISLVCVCTCRMVRKRKSLPRDSKGFEPIEEYLKEVEEDLNQSSGGKTLKCWELCG